MSSANIARHLPLMAASAPGRPAVKIPRGRTGSGGIDYLTLSFAELDAEVDAWVVRLAAAGIRRGDRVLVMVRQGLPLIAAAFALFKHGAVPVIIDPGMGRKSFLACVARTRPTALLGIPLAQLLSRVWWRPFASVKSRIWVSGSPTSRLTQASPIASRKSEIVHCSASDLAAVLFTSGSTGAPKGVRYEHGMFDAQVRLVRETYAIEPGEIDLPMLPIFALFNPALGMTTVVPELDPSRPATVNPAKIVQAIRQEKVTNSFGSPTLWRKIAAHCRHGSITLPSLRRVLMAGAPVPPALFADVQAILPHGAAHSPYGATESLPVASISAAEILGGELPRPGAGRGPAPASSPHDNTSSAGDATPTTPARNQPSGTAPAAFTPAPSSLAAATATGAGTCLGRPVEGIAVRIITLTDTPIADLSRARELPVGAIGEIIASGPVVTREYDGLPEATAAAKIPAAGGGRGKCHPTGDTSGGAGRGVLWHRMGDAGYLDAEGRLWFCGRTAERVQTADGPLFTEQVEPIFNAHPDVRRTALIGIGEPGRQRPALVVEPRDRSVLASPARQRQLARELRSLGAAQPQAGRVRLMFFHPEFPVDVRHNAKIHRLALARWAATQTGQEMDCPGGGPAAEAAAAPSS